MADSEDTHGIDRRLILDRADRMLKQSRTLRQLSEQLQKESRDLKRESDDLRKSAKPKANRSRLAGKKG